MDSLSNYRILDVDQETTVYYATLQTELKKAGTPIPANEVWVAALCRQTRLPILSRDRHFDIVAGLRRIDW
jgi:tRNA(fMet)-specific endonuclease VapC